MAVCGAIGGRFCGRRFFGLRRVLRSVGDEGFGASTAGSGAVVGEHFVSAAGAGYWSEVALLFLFGFGRRRGRFCDLWRRRDD